MAMQYKPNDFNHKCQIGLLKTITTATGGKVEKIAPDSVIVVRFASKMRTIAFQFQLIGTEASDTFEIVIRHNILVTKKMCIQIDGVLYNIINISPDESAKIMRYDILTLQSKKKGG